jgi:hypothetical protein
VAFTVPRSLVIALSGTLADQRSCIVPENLPERNTLTGQVRESVVLQSVFGLSG